jgi:branched-chain amino acid transport system substrate-binding protein
VTKGALIVPNNSFGPLFSDIFRKYATEYYKTKAGKSIEIMGPIYTKPGATDYKYEIAQMLNAGVQGVMSSVSVNADAFTFYRQVQQLGLGSRVAVVGDMGTEMALGKAMGNQILENYWSKTEWNPAVDPSNAMSQYLLKACIEMAHDPRPHNHVGVAYDTVHTIAAAVKTAGTTDTQPVVAALESMKFDTVKGPAHFRKEDHQVVREFNLVKLGKKAGALDGWGVVDTFRTPMERLIEPPSPGIEFKV